MSLPPLQILYEDNHCLAIFKPAGCLTTGYEGGEETLDRQVKQYLKEKYQKPGNVFLGVVHRLDRPVSGVLLYARNSKAAGRLAEQFREGQVAKVYWAIVEGQWPHEAGELQDWLRKDRDIGRVEVLSPEAEGARQAVLRFQRCGMATNLTWLEIRPQTGRTHQIRVQLASRGHPVYGDSKYGSAHAFGSAIALHARSLTFLHPIRYEPITLTAELPTAWKRFLSLGLPGPA
jgi:23S rRNA pseudouridine1911/1915/1917 synthase